MAASNSEASNNEFNIMNINLANDFDNFKEPLRNLITKYQPGIITFQELKSAFYDKINEDDEYEKVEVKETSTFSNAIVYKKSRFKCKTSYTFNDLRFSKKIKAIHLEEKDTKTHFLVATFHNYKKKKDKLKFEYLFEICGLLLDKKSQIERKYNKKISIIIGTDTNIQNLIRKKEQEPYNNNNDFNNFNIYGSDKTFQYFYSTIRFTKINYCYFLLGETDEIEIKTAEKAESLNNLCLDFLDLERRVVNIASSIDDICKNMKKLFRNDKFVLKHINEGYTAFQNSLKSQINVFSAIKNYQISSPILQEDLNNVSYIFLNPPAYYNNVVQHPILISKIVIKSPSNEEDNQTSSSNEGDNR